LAPKNHFLRSSSPKITTLKIIEHLSQNQVNKLNCLCHVFSQSTYTCSRGYISISSAKYDKFVKITRFSSLYHFSKWIPFWKQNKLNPSHDSLNTSIELIEHKFKVKNNPWALGRLRNSYADFHKIHQNLLRVFSS
jgi:hypothetical protein